MTAEHFQRRYQNYGTRDFAAAMLECDKANAEGIDGHIAVVVEFDYLGFCLMLNVAAEEIRHLGIISMEKIYIPTPRSMLKVTQ